MRRLLTILTAGLLLLVSLSSCSKLNKEMDYTFGYHYAAYIANETDRKAVEDFIESYFLNSDKKPVYYGKLNDVVGKAGEFFMQTVTAPEVGEFFYSKIQDEKDIIAVEGYVSSQYGDCWIGTWTWKWADKHPAE